MPRMSMLFFDFLAGNAPHKRIQSANRKNHETQSRKKHQHPPAWKENPNQRNIQGKNQIDKGNQKSQDRHGEHDFHRGRAT